MINLQPYKTEKQTIITFMNILSDSYKPATVCTFYVVFSSPTAIHVCLFSKSLSLRGNNNLQAAKSHTDNLNFSWGFGSCSKAALLVYFGKLIILMIPASKCPTKIIFLLFRVNSVHSILFFSPPKMTAVDV